MTSPLKNPRHLASAYCELGCVQDAVAYIHSLFWIYVPFSFLLAVFCLMFQCPDLCLVCLVFIFQILTHSHLLTAPLLHFHLCGLCPASSTHSVHFQRHPRYPLPPPGSEASLGGRADLDCLSRSQMPRLLLLLSLCCCTRALSSCGEPRAPF